MTDPPPTLRTTPRDTIRPLTTDRAIDLDLADGPTVSYLIVPKIVRAATATDYAIRLDSVSKVYGSTKSAVQALDAVSIALRRGTFTAVMGPSGSGKSTFLNCAAGLDHPTSGSVWLGNVELSALGEVQRTEVRRQRIGFIFQAYNLLGSLTVEENVVLPLRLADRRTDRAFLRQVLAAVGLGEHAARRPSELSGGQQQRVAIARALISQPDVVVADEPTGALDSRSSKQVLELLRQVVDEMGQTVLMVTHDPLAASYADSVVFLADGKLAGELARPTVEQVSSHLTQLGDW